MIRSTRYVRAGVVLAVAALGASGTTIGASAPTEPTGDSAASAAPADGEPIRIGYINQEEGSGSTFVDIRTGAEAAVAAFNAAGGADGRPIELVTCATDGSPEASQGCANEVLEAGVVAVASGIDYGGPSAIPIVTDAGIPYLPTLPTSSEDYGTPGVFTFFGGSAGQYTGQIPYILSEYQPDSVGVLVINVPAGVGAAEAFVKGPLEAAGVKVTMVAADATTADFTTPLQAIMREDPDVITVLFTGPPCGTIMQARGSLGITVPTFFPSGCIDEEFIAAGGAGAEGAIFSIESVLPELYPDDPDVVAYLAAMDEYAGVAAEDLTNYQQVGYVNLYNLAQVITEVDGDITADSVAAALAATVDHPSPMSGSFTCDGTALAGFPTICNAAVRFVQREGDSFVELTPDWVTPA